MKRGPLDSLLEILNAARKAAQELAAIDASMRQPAAPSVPVAPRVYTQADFHRAPRTIQ